MGTFLEFAFSAIGVLFIAVAAGAVLCVMQSDYGRHASPTALRQRILAPAGSMHLADEPDRDAVDWDVIQAADARAEEEWSDVLASHTAWMRASAHRKQEARQLPVAA